MEPLRNIKEHEFVKTGNEDFTIGGWAIAGEINFSSIPEATFTFDGGNNINWDTGTLSAWFPMVHTGEIQELTQPRNTTLGDLQTVIGGTGGYTIEYETFSQRQTFTQDYWMNGQRAGEEYLRIEMARNLGQKLLEDGFITVTQENDELQELVHLDVKLQAVKPTN